MPYPDLARHGEQRTAPRLIERFGTMLLQWLKTGNPAATIDRLFVSKHVNDLRFIVSVAALLLCVGAALSLLYAIAVVLEPANDSVSENDPFWEFIKIVGVAVGLLATLVAVFGAVGAWAYKVGSTRLGVVDLFACEMTTLCRVTLVTNVVGRLVNRIERAGRADTRGTAPVPETVSQVTQSGEQKTSDRSSSPILTQFRSAENYFPVFEGNTRDLQSLEARVVINITSFYTYMKTVRDLMRTAAALRPEPVTVQSGKVDVLQADDWRNAMRDVIYMLFLGLEAGRDSVGDLVEYDPEWAERTIIILLSELKAYLFLLLEFADTDEMHARRLHLRWDGYQKLRSDLTSEIKGGVQKAAAGLTRAKATELALRELDLKIWEGAEKLLPDLELIYQKLDAAILSRQ